MTRRNFIQGTAALCGGFAVSNILGACAQSAPTTSSSQALGGNAGAPLVVGTLATEDLLPLWVALEEGMVHQAGVNVEIMPFQSATELIAGVASGEVDLAMTDIMVSASMFASGIDVCMRWVALGTTPEQGRFGIMAGPNSTITSLSDLAGVPIAVGSNTILEYVMDKLLLGAGLSSSDIVVEEIQKLPVRYQALLSGEVAAAALPASLLALGEAEGCILVADDTQGENLSQSVMIARTDLLASPEGATALEALQNIWDEAVGVVNANPENFRTTLVEHANLPESIAADYPICTYPSAQMPSASMVEPVLAWMDEKGYLSAPLAYNETAGTFERV